MVRYFEKKGDKLMELTGLQSGCWINISPPFNLTEIETLAGHLGIPLDFLTDSLDIDERTRYEVEDDARLIVINSPILNDESNEERTLYITVPIGIIVTPDNIITIASYDNPVMQGFTESRFRNSNPHDRSLFVLQILEQIVYHYLRCLKDINVRRGVVEQEVYESSKNKDLKKLLNLEKSLVYFVTALSANALLMQRIQRMDLLFVKADEEKADLLEDIIVDNSQAQEMAHIYSNVLSSTMDALASLISNNLNEVMQRLTLITIILMVPTLIASFYGMNTKHLPLQDEPYTFWVLVGGSVLLSVVLAVIFRARKLF